MADEITVGINIVPKTSGLAGAAVAGAAGGLAAGVGVKLLGQIAKSSAILTGTMAVLLRTVGLLLKPIGDILGIALIPILRLMQPLVITINQIAAPLIKWLLQQQGKETFAKPGAVFGGGAGAAIGGTLGGPVGALKGAGIGATIGAFIGSLFEQEGKGIFGDILNAKVKETDENFVSLTDSLVNNGGKIVGVENVVSKSFSNINTTATKDMGLFSRVVENKLKETQEFVSLDKWGFAGSLIAYLADIKRQADEILSGARSTASSRRERTPNIGDFIGIAGLSINRFIDAVRGEG